MVTEPEQPKETSVVEDGETPVVANPETVTVKDEGDDTMPLTVDEFKDTARQVVTTVKDGIFIPVYRIGRRWLRGAEGAADEFFGGATGDRKGKR